MYATEARLRLEVDKPCSARKDREQKPRSTREMNISMCEGTMGAIPYGTEIGP